MKQRKPFYMSA